VGQNRIVSRASLQVRTSIGPPGGRRLPVSAGVQDETDALLLIPLAITPGRG
jgi:hypothetical protein